MKIKNVKLEWYVLNHNCNGDKITKYNIFSSNSPTEIAQRIKKNQINTYNEFKESMRQYFMYHYWSRAEYEILVSGLHTRKEPEKIDVYTQIEPNLDIIIEYIIREMKIEFKGGNKNEHRKN